MTKSLPRFIAAPVALSLLLLTLSPAITRAQVSGPCPDGFTGACCALASPNLPTLPAVTWNDARQTCWIDCGPFPNAFGSLTLGAPVPTGACGVFQAPLTGSLMGCLPPSNAGLRLYYTRHWQQAFPSTGAVVVYRFVAVGKVCIGGPPGWSCAVERPPATPFVFGFVDYAFRKVGPPPCNLQFVAAALAVGHPCDRFVHDPSCPFVADPLPPTHPLDQYVLVAPGSAFTPSGTLVPPQGAANNVAREGLRLVQPSSTGTCTPNERITSLMLRNHAQQCACVNPSMTGGPFTRQSLDLSTGCGSALQSSPVCPFNVTPPPMTPPFPTLFAWSIGSWGPAQFPGLPGPGGNRFFLTQGSGVYQRPATAVCPQVVPQRDVYYGVENAWGSPMQKLARRVDLVDNAQPVVGSNTYIPVVGGPGPVGTHVVFFY